MPFARQTRLKPCRGQKTTYDFFAYAGLHKPMVLYTDLVAHIDDVTVVSTIEGRDRV